MANSILGSVDNVPRNGGNSLPTYKSGATNPMQLMQQFQQFRNTFQGNPQQMIQQMLQSGRINEAQLQQAMQMARQFQHFVK